MILTSLVFSIAASQGTAAPPTAGALVSKMFGRYTSAKSFSGRIKTIQTARGLTVTTDTILAYERPSKIRLDQSQTGPKVKRSTTLVSNGIVFEYTKPQDLFGEPILKEPVQPEGRKAQTIGDMYTVVGGDIPDRSPVLDMLVARREDLARFRDRIFSVGLGAKETINGRTTNVVVGGLKEPGTATKMADYKLYLTEEGEIVRFVIVQNYAVPAANPRPGLPPVPGDPVTVTTTWDIAGTVDAPLEAGTFKLPVG